MTCPRRDRDRVARPSPARSPPHHARGWARASRATGRGCPGHRCRQDPGAAGLDGCCGHCCSSTREKETEGGTQTLDRFEPPARSSGVNPPRCTAGSTVVVLVRHEIIRIYSPYSWMHDLSFRKLLETNQTGHFISALGFNGGSEMSRSGSCRTQIERLDWTPYGTAHTARIDRRRAEPIGFFLRSHLEFFSTTSVRRALLFPRKFPCLLGTVSASSCWSL